jgi:hypothetical protein
VGVHVGVCSGGNASRSIRSLGFHGDHRVFVYQFEVHYVIY